METLEKVSDQTWLEILDLEDMFSVPHCRTNHAFDDKGFYPCLHAVVATYSDCQTKKLPVCANTVKYVIDCLLGQTVCAGCGGMVRDCWRIDPVAS